MFKPTEYSWLIFLLLTAVIYTIPTFYRIWKLRKRKAAIHRHPAGKRGNQPASALLGVVYPSDEDTGR